MLTRARQGKMVAGVCAGLGRATGTDPILFRVILTVLVFFGGIGALLYLFAWVLLPVDDEPASPLESLLGRGRSGTSPALTIGLIALAGLVLVGSFSNGFQTTLLLAACLIGGALLLRRPHGDQTGGPHPGGPPFGGSDPTGQPGHHGGWAAGATPPGTPTDQAFAASAPDHVSQEAWRIPAAGPGMAPPQQPAGHGYGDSQPAGPYAPQYAPYAQPFAPYGPYGPGTAPYNVQPVPPVPPLPPTGRRRRRQRERSVLGRLTFSLACLALVVLATIDGAGGSIPFTGYVALALGIVAAGLLVGVWIGRARGLIVLGVLLSVALGVGSIAENVDDHGGGAENVVFRPTTAAQVRSDYTLGGGDLRLDLSAVDFTGVTKTVHIESGFGDTTVTLPQDVDVDIEYDVSAGDSDVLGQSNDGFGIHNTRVDDGLNGPDSSALRLEIQHGLGDLEVTR